MCYLFDSEIINMIVEETFHSALTENITNHFKFIIDDVYYYIEILIYMSIYRYPKATEIEVHLDL